MRLRKAVIRAGNLNNGSSLSTATSNITGSISHNSTPKGIVFTAITLRDEKRQNGSNPSQGNYSIMIQSATINGSVFDVTGSLSGITDPTYNESKGTTHAFADVLTITDEA